MRPRKYSQLQIAEALQLKAQGEKWAVLELTMGPGIKNACYHATNRNREPGQCTSYRRGVKARDHNEPRDPPMGHRADRSWWLAGWSDRDQELRQSIAP